MGTLKAYLGYIAVMMLVLVPLFTILIIGARTGRGRKKSDSSWTKILRPSPLELKESVTKIRPK